MVENLAKHFQKFVDIRDEDLPQIGSFFKAVQVKKKVALLTEGQVCKSMYFVIKGCLRMFFVDEKGVEQTTQFAIENWWLTDYLSFQNQRSETI